MAPNVQRIRLLATPLASAGRAAVMAKNYVTRPTTTVAATEAYWMWETPVDLFSVDRITKNLLLDAQQRNSLVAASSQQYNPANDQYWAGHEQQQQQPRTEHAADNQSTDVVVAKATERSCFWSEPFPARHYDDATSPATYWDEHNYALQQWSDRYWYSAGTPKQAESGCDYYQQWKNGMAAARWVM